MDKVLLTRVDEYIVERIEYITNNSKDIELTKSEVVRIILHAFFKSQKDKDFEKVREFRNPICKNQVMHPFVWVTQYLDYPLKQIKLGAC